MTKFTIGDQGNNEQQFCYALKKANDGDVIELLPGEYFSPDTSLFLEIDKNITIRGRYSNASATKLFCGFFTGNKTTAIFQNLTVNNCKHNSNTICAFDNSEIYAKNVIFKHSPVDHWDTVYIKDSNFSIESCQILTDSNETHALSIENGRVTAVDSIIQFLYEKNATFYLKSSLITFAANLDDKSQLLFDELTIDSSNNPDYSDIYICQQSTVDGSNLSFAVDEPFIDVLESNFEIFNSQPISDKIRWRYDELSNVLANGENPYTNGPLAS